MSLITIQFNSEIKTLVTIDKTLEVWMVVDLRNVDLPPTIHP